MDALRRLNDKANRAIFAKYGVFTERELGSRFEVFLEDYHRKIRIEGEVALEMARTMIAPAVEKAFAGLCRAAAEAKSSGVISGSKAVRARAEELGKKLDELNVRIGLLEKALDGKHEEILAAMGELRVTADALEKLTPDELWPLPKYREMLFVY